ncbi:hypothetical protein ABZ401_11930 [Streptomyces sp. NPDC005892]|uniref:hypothetical protein n=1 Tax=Streptomyces sp. NPDC005892 TaxID=3155593 RepID=UPI003407267D
MLTRAVRRQTAYVGLAVGSLIAGLGRVADSRPWYVGLILGDAATFVLAHWRQRGYRPRPPGHGAPVRLLLAALFVAVGPLISPVVRWADRTREAVRAGSTVAGVRAPATRVRTDDERATEPRREARTP